MSNNQRDRLGGKKEPKSDLLNELDSLKSLLNEEKEEELAPAPWEYTPPKEIASQRTAPATAKKLTERPRPSAPARKERPQNRVTDKKQSEIPVLKEVAFTPDNKPVTIPELVDVVEKVGNKQPTVPNSKELMNLVELLVERRLEKLKPVLKEEILKELLRMHPSLLKR